MKRITRRAAKRPVNARRRTAIALILVALLPALACNLPVRALESSRVDEAAAQTLTARAPSALGGETTPLPGLPIVTVSGSPAVNPDSVNSALPAGQVTPFPIPPSGSRLEGNTFYYITQPGDTRAALALRFGLDISQILDPRPDQPQALLAAGQQLALPDTLADFDSGGRLVPDSEVIYSPASLDFSVEDAVRQAGGYLSGYSEAVDGKTLTGAQIIQRVANETSINPRLLLAVLEYRSHWVNGAASEVNRAPYPIGFYAPDYAGLYKEMTLTARQLTLGYYG
jgi:LysM repeat protein